MSDDDIDQDRVARLVRMLERPLESIDWKEFHFSGEEWDFPKQKRTFR
jgi:hypothetical protein